MRAAGPHTAGPHRSVAWLLVLSLWAPVLLPAQAGHSAQVAEILEQLREQFSRVEDYQVDLKVSLRMPLLRMPQKKMTLSFKQPDQLHLEARGFAIVPRRGVMLAPDSLFKGLLEPTVVGARHLDGFPAIVIRGVQPVEGEAIIVVELVVDTQRWVVPEIITYLDGEEIFRIESAYLEVIPGIYLPQETHLEFDISEQFLTGMRGVPLPSGARKLMGDRDTIDLEENASLVGEATVVFSDYRVNEGIPDQYFEEETE